MPEFIRGCAGAPALLNALVSLVTAFALGGMIGLERQMRQRTVGLRTNTRVAVGAIMKEGANVTGLNTAATLWGSGAVGACAGSGLIGEAVLAALFVLASNTLLRPVVNRINRRPVNEETSEATLYATAVVGEDLDRVTTTIEGLPGVTQAFWNSGAEEWNHVSGRHGAPKRLLG